MTRRSPIRLAIDFLRASLDELRKVVWPTREQSVQYTVIVVASVIVVTAVTAPPPPT